MRDARDELDFWGRQLLRKSQMHPLRKAMNEYVSERPPAEDLQKLRRRTSGGSTLSDLVEDGREERF